MSLKTVDCGKWKVALVTWMSVREYSARLMSSVENGSCSSHVITRSVCECCPGEPGAREERIQCHGRETMKC